MKHDYTKIPYDLVVVGDPLYGERGKDPCNFDVLFAFGIDLAIWVMWSPSIAMIGTHPIYLHDIVYVLLNIL
jgi:hypothetical protein